MAAGFAWLALIVALRGGMRSQAAAVGRIDVLGSASASFMARL